MIKHTEYQEYDECNRLIHFVNLYGYEEWYEYDKYDNVIYSKNSNGFERWLTYDNNGNMIHYRNSEGYEYWCKYIGDVCSYYRDSNGNEKYYIVNKKENCSVLLAL